MELCQPSGVLSPPPLQILKRGRDKPFENGSPRTDVSANTYQSLETTPVRQDHDQPLTVVKKRGNKRNQVYSSEGGESSFGDVSSRIFTPEKSTHVLLYLNAYYPLTVIEYAAPGLVNTTPRASGRPLSRRSSSFQALRSHPPKLLNKLRSFSNGRILSSKATCRHYDLTSRDSSISSSRGSPPPYAAQPPAHLENDIDSSFGSSSSEASYDLHPFMPLGYSGLDGYECRQPSNSFSSVHEPAGSIMDPYVLVPHITITPEASTLNAGDTTVWVAIEVSGQLCHPTSGKSSPGVVQSNHDNYRFLPVHHCEANLTRYGYLYDIRVDIPPTPGSGVIGVLNDDVARFVSIHPNEGNQF
jgi:hypothetical protein